MDKRMKKNNKRYIDRRWFHATQMSVCLCVCTSSHHTGHLYQQALIVDNKLRVRLLYCTYLTKMTENWMCAMRSHSDTATVFSLFLLLVHDLLAHLLISALGSLQNLSAGVNYANWKCQHEWHALSGGKNIAEMSETDDGDDKVNKPRRNGMDRVFADLELQQVLCKIVVILATSCLNLCW